MERLFLTLPTGPITAGAANAEISRVHQPWSFVRSGDETVVYLPNNLEAMADNPLAQICLAACKCIKPIYRTTSEDMPFHEFDKKQSAYLLGIAWGLNTDGQMQTYHDLSGALGHGYYYVGHKILTHNLGNAWWAKGSPWHFTKGLTGKAWSKDLDATTISASALVSYACQCVPLGDNWKTWTRARESFIGRELRKELKLRGSHVISELEAQYLERKYSRSLEAYHNALQGLESPTTEWIKGLSSHLKKVGASLAELSMKIDEVTSHRMSVLYPKEKGKSKKGPRAPIQERVTKLEKEEFIFCFDPVVWGGFPPFRPSLDTDGIIDIQNSLADYNKRLEKIRRTNAQLADLAEVFALEHLTS
jgi:hypothetical protein